MDISLHYGDIGFDVAINVGAIIFSVMMLSLCYITKKPKNKE